MLSRAKMVAVARPGLRMKLHLGHHATDYMQNQTCGSSLHYA